MTAVWHALTASVATHLLELKHKHTGQSVISACQACYSKLPYLQVMQDHKIVLPPSLSSTLGPQRARARASTPSWLPSWHMQLVKLPYTISFNASTCH